MDDLILVKDIPPELVDGVLREIVNFTIAFLRVDNHGGRNDAHLLGSGVLVSVGARKAILTAHHVVEALPTRGKIGLFLGRTTQPHTIDAEGMSAVKIARGTEDSIGPDLAAIVLAPHVASSIGAKKSFFNLDLRREILLKNPPDVRDGVWLAQGFLEERTSVGPDPLEDGTTKYFYNFSGVGGPDASQEINGFDYFEFPVSHEARNIAPRSWGGMSGGGLWQVQLKRNAGGLTSLPPVLSGIMFYQHPTTATECGVRGHARRSVYEIAYYRVDGK